MSAVLPAVLSPGGMAGASGGGGGGVTGGVGRLSLATGADVGTGDG